MWKLLPKSLVLKVTVYIFSLLSVAISILISKYFFDDNHLYSDDFSQALKISSIASFMTSIIIFTLGKWGWKLFWNLPILGQLLNRYVCPDLNGEWIGKIQSNYLVEGEKVIKDVEVIIKVDFFVFSMDLQSHDKYQASKVVQSDIYKDARNKTFYIAYIFESTVLDPKESDDKTFEGAARLEIKYNNEPIKLEGFYWTNRASQKQLNTAGTITLSKKNS